MCDGQVEEREGVYYVPGTRISLDSIVYAFREGSSPEAIRDDFEGLNLARVYDAIAFYLKNQADIDAYLLRRRDHWNELECKGSRLPPDLQSRLDHARQRISLHGK